MAMIVEMPLWVLCLSLAAVTFNAWIVGRFYRDEEIKAKPQDPEQVD